MKMKEYLIDTFKFNDYANKKILVRIKELNEKEMCIKYFSHLINSQNKWMARIVKYPGNPQLDWWTPVYNLEELENEWDRSLQQWLKYLENLTEKEILEDKKFIGYDGGTWIAQLKDIALQLNYHSIHHRAQIQTIIRQQGFEPDFIDYIGTRFRKIN